MIHEKGRAGQENKPQKALSRLLYIMCFLLFCNYEISFIAGGRLWTPLCSMMCKNYAEW